MKKVFLSLVMLFCVLFASDYQDIVKSLEKSCDKKDTKACYELANIYLNANQIEQNITKAKEFYKKSCDGGFEKACDDLEIKNSQEFFQLNDIFGKTCGAQIEPSCEENENLEKKR